MDHRRSLGAALFAACALVAVIGLAITVVAHPGPLPGEAPAVRRWQQLGGPVPTLADWVRLMTSTQATIVFAAIPASWLISHYHWSGVMAVLIVAGTMLVAQPVIKEVIDRPRPTEAHVDVRAPYTSKSFPSGHSMSTTAAWGTAAVVAARHGRSRAAVALCIPLALTAAASQIQGVHWPTDALAGTLIGGIAVASAATVLPRPDRSSETIAAAG